MPIAPLTKQELEELGWGFTETHTPSILQTTKYLQDTIRENPLHLSPYVLQSVKLFGSTNNSQSVFYGEQVAFNENEDEFLDSDLEFGLSGLWLKRACSFQSKGRYNIVAFSCFTTSDGTGVVDTTVHPPMRVIYPFTPEPYFKDVINIGELVLPKIGYIYFVYTDEDRANGVVNVTPLLAPKSYTMFIGQPDLGGLGGL